MTGVHTVTYYSLFSSFRCISDTSVRARDGAPMVLGYSLFPSLLSLPPSIPTLLRHPLYPFLPPRQHKIDSDVRMLLIISIMVGHCIGGCCLPFLLVSSSLSIQGDVVRVCQGLRYVYVELAAESRGTTDAARDALVMLLAGKARVCRLPPPLPRGLFR